MENRATGIQKGFSIAGNALLLAAFLTSAYLINNSFFTYPVMVSVLKGVALISVLGIAESFVLASGGIDLSIAGTSLLSATILFYFVETSSFSVVTATLISFAAATFIGFINGLFIAKLGIQPVIVTLGTSLLAHGIAGSITSNISIFDTCPEFRIFQTAVSFIPVSLIVSLLVLVACYVVFKYTIAGRQILAVGGSERSAKLSGLNVDKIKIYTYTAAGFISGIGGLLVLADSTMSARFFSGSAELVIIFVAVMGGVSLFSGARIFLRVFVGSFVIAVINRLIYGLFVFNYARTIIIAILFLVLLAFKKNMFKGDNTSG